MNTHPVDGARDHASDEDLGMAATVAYEASHHAQWRWVPLHYTRECAMASRLVHVCDVYDALSTTRPCARSGRRSRRCCISKTAAVRVRSELVNAFIRTLRQGQAQVRVLSDEQQT